MKKYDWKNEYNPIRRTAKRLLSGEPLSDGRPLSDLIELDEHARKCLAFEATLTDRQIDMLPYCQKADWQDHLYRPCAFQPDRKRDDGGQNQASAP